MTDSPAPEPVLTELPDGFALWPSGQLSVLLRDGSTVEFLNRSGHPAASPKSHYLLDRGGWLVPARVTPPQPKHTFLGRLDMADIAQAFYRSKAEGWTLEVETMRGSPRRCTEVGAAGQDHFRMTGPDGHIALTAADRRQAWKVEA